MKITTACRSCGLPLEVEQNTGPEIDRDDMFVLERAVTCPDCGRFHSFGSLMRAIQQEDTGETTLEDLRPGALFLTPSGNYAVKSEYRYSNGQCQCVLLSSGEYAHFAEGNKTRVKEVTHWHKQEDIVP